MTEGLARVSARVFQQCVEVSGEEGLLRFGGGGYPPSVIWLRDELM
jgi:hypothetical protein